MTEPPAVPLELDDRSEATTVLGRDRCGLPGAARTGIDLYWLPLGAGGHCVRINGRAYEALTARREHRLPRELYHSALQVRAHGTWWTIEMGPVWNAPSSDHDAVCRGPVGARPLGRFRAFRYEVRCWREGRIPDVDEAVDGPQCVSTDSRRAVAVLDLVRTTPSLTWGRDELRCGDMWNSNSLVAWLLAATGHDMSRVTPPPGGRAPGWFAGLCLAKAHPAIPSAGAPAGSLCDPRSYGV